MRAQKRGTPRKHRAKSAAAIGAAALLAAPIAFAQSPERSVVGVAAEPAEAAETTAAPLGGAQEAQRSSALVAAWRALDADALDTALASFDAFANGVGVGGGATPEQRLEARRGRAEALSRLNRHAEALAAFDGLVRAAPRDPEVWFQRGLALFRSGRPDRAIANLQTATTAAPTVARYGRRLGDSLYAVGDARRALSEYQRAASLTSAPPGSLWRAIGNAQYALGAFAAADEAYSKAIELDPSDAAATLYRGWTRHELGRNALAIADFDAAIALAPSDAALLSARGDLKRLGDDLDGALEDFRLALTAAPRHGPALYGIARTLLDRGRLAETEPFIEALFEISENDEALRALALGLRGRADLERRDFAAADADFSALLQLRPRDADGHYNRGVARIGLNDIAGATEDLREVVRLRPNDPRAFYAYGRATLALGGGREGVRAIETAEERLQALERAAQTAGDGPLAPDADLLKDARLARGLAWTAFGDEASAIRDFGKVLEAAPADVRALRLQTEALLRRGRANLALERAKQLIEARPEDPIGWLLEGDAAIAVGQTEEARRALRRAAALGADPGAVARVTGRSWLADAERAENVAAAETALFNAVEAFDAEVASTNAAPEALARRAEVAARLGRYDLAKVDLDQAIARQPMSADLRFARADVLGALGRCDEAIRDYDLGLNMDADNGAQGARAECKWREGRVFGAIGDYVGSWF